MQKGMEKGKKNVDEGKKCKKNVYMKGKKCTNSRKM